MSTSKHIDKICAAVLAVTLILTILFMNGEALGISVADRSMGYENRLFDTDTVHTVDIVMDDWDGFIENCESEEYSSCTVVIDGEKYANVGIRAKGNTSLSNVKSLGSERYSFKLEFDQYENGKSYYGLDKLCLNNLIQDNTMMKDYIVYQMMNDFGVDSPLCSYTYITVNGEDWGLYLAVEGIEDSFLERNYGSEQGELYKPDSMSFGGGRGNGKEFNMDDFDFSGNGASTETQDAENTQTPTVTDSGTENGEMPTMPDGSDFSGFSGGEMPTMPDGSDFSGFGDGEMPTMPEGNSEDGNSAAPDMSQTGGGMGSGMGSDDVKLKYIDDDPDSYSNIFDNAKTDTSTSDKERLISALKNLSEYTDLENTLDMDEVLRYFVVHNFVCNGDSYTGSMVHNYYLYEEDGLLSMIPWDYNLAFGTFQGNDASGTVNTSIDSPVSGGSTDDRPMVGWIFSDEEYTEMYHELFSEFIDKWFSNGELEKLISETAEMISPYVEKDPTKFCTTEEFESGVSALTEFVKLRAEAVGKQLSGDTTAVDTGDLNLSDMGTMNAGMGGGNTAQQAFGGNTEQTQPDAQESESTEMPQMPNGEQTQTDGEMPQMPSGEQTQTNGEMPQMPSSDQMQNSGQMPQMPNGAEMSTGATPEASESSAPQAPENTESSTQEGEKPAAPDGNTVMPQGDSNSMPQAEAEESSNPESAYALIGISFAVLAIGLIVAAKYKQK